MSEQGGYSFGFYKQDGSIEDRYDFSMNVYEPFKRIFSFGSLIDYEQEYRLITFANYLPIEFQVNGTLAQYYDFIAKPYETCQMEVVFPGMSEGFYSILFVVIKNPHDQRIDDEYRAHTEMNHLINVRFSFRIANASTWPPFIDSSNLEMEQTSSSLLDNIFLNKDANKLVRTLYDSACSEEQCKYYVHIGNIDNFPKQYIVLLLYDWTPVKIGEYDFLSLTVDSNTYLSVPVELKSLGEEGIHNFTAIAIESPYEIMAIESPGAVCSVRIAIEVQ